jgi:hypothetical protein
LLALGSLVAFGDAAVAAAEKRAAKPSASKQGPRQAPSRIYKWTDENGVTHYGESIPPQYRSQGGTELNKRAITVRQLDPLATPEQRQAALDKQRLAQEEEKRAAEQKRRDNALLNTYTSPREIEAARDRSLALPLQAIRGLEPRIQQGEEHLAELERKAAAAREAGKPTDHLDEQIAEQKRDLDGMRGEVTRHERQAQNIRARYDADRDRYMELTELSPR